MRKFQKMLTASVLMLLPVSFASAQDYQQGGGRQNRQYGGQDQGGNGGGYGGGNGGFGGDRQSRRQQFGGNNGFGNNGGFGNGNNGNGFGRDRQRGLDNGGSTTPSTPTPLTKTERPAFVPPVATGPFVFKAMQLPQEFALLNTKSIFSKDHRSTQTDVKPVVFPDAPVAALVLRGAMRLDVGEKPFTAYIEDTNGSKPPTWVVEGQFLTSSGARVTDITLDHIIVEKNGARRLITIGVNLDQGENLPNSSSGTASVSPTAGANSGDSQVKIAASDAGNTSGEDVADMMRRRRQQELGQ